MSTKTTARVEGYIGFGDLMLPIDRVVFGAGRVTASATVPSCPKVCDWHVALYGQDGRQVTPGQWVSQTVWDPSDTVTVQVTLDLSTTTFDTG